MLLPFGHSDIIPLLYGGLFILPVWLYAEIHFRLPFWRGRLYRPYPEVIFDAPFRVHGSTIPVLLLIKDSHWFPLELQQLEMRLREPATGHVWRTVRIEINRFLQQKYFYHLAHIPIDNGLEGLVEIDCTAFCRQGSRRYLFRNDNLPTLPHAPLKVFIDSRTWPRLPGWLWGDLHCHSGFTEDQVEFGAPAEVYPVMGAAQNLDFCALTDHSYDLDDCEDSWTINDPALQRWRTSRATIAGLNQQYPDFCLIPGEEISVDNGFGRNCHLVVLNSARFFEGQGDSMERFLHTEAHYHYAQVVDSIPESAIAFAAHPDDPPPFSQRLLLRRGKWNRYDYLRGLAGFQIMNGIIGQDFHQGLERWCRYLLQGRRCFIYAGNDSHGNFGCFRQVRIPLWLNHQHNRQRFGEQRTALLCHAHPTIDNLVRALKTGQAVISTGPMCDFRLTDNENHSATIGENLAMRPSSITLRMVSSPFFGAIQRLDVYLGDFVCRSESKIVSIEPGAPLWQLSDTVPLTGLPDRGYCRAEGHTDKGQCCLTNPVWFGPSSHHSI